MDWEEGMNWCKDELTQKETRRIRNNEDKEWKLAWKTTGVCIFGEIKRFPKAYAWRFPFRDLVKRCDRDYFYIHGANLRKALDCSRAKCKWEITPTQTQTVFLATFLSLSSNASQEGKGYRENRTHVWERRTINSWGLNGRHSARVQALSCPSPYSSSKMRYR